MTKRRGHNEGGIYQRSSDGLWIASISMGYDYKGKRKRRTIYGKTKRDVQFKLKELQMNELSGALTEPNKINLTQFLSHWLEDTIRPKLSASTYIRYEGLIRNHINQHIGGTPLTKVTALLVQNYYGRLDRNDVPGRTKELVHTLLSKAFKHAVQLGLISNNPCDSVEKPKSISKEIQPLNMSEVKELLEAAKDDRLYALYEVAIFTGLRMGELLGLKWEDIDFTQGTLYVRRQLVEVKGHAKLAPPKTKSGKRNITLPSRVQDALKTHQQAMFEEGLRASEFVFCDTKGGSIRKSNLRRRSFYKILDKAGIDRIRFHDLRHTFATLLLQKNTHPKIVQEMLGHASIKHTLDIYSHAIPSIQEEAMRSFDQYLDEALGS